MACPPGENAVYLLLVNHMVFLQELFDVRTADRLQRRFEHQLFFEAKLHICDLASVAQHYGGVQQRAQVIKPFTRDR